MMGTLVAVGRLLQYLCGPRLCRGEPGLERKTLCTPRGDSSCQTACCVGIWEALLEDPQKSQDTNWPVDSVKRPITPMSLYSKPQALQSCVISMPWYPDPKKTSPKERVAGGGRCPSFHPRTHCSGWWEMGVADIGNDSLLPGKSTSFPQRSGLPLISSR